MQLTRDEVLDLLEAIGLDPEADLLTDYEGRGPTRPCVALYLNPEVTPMVVGIGAASSLGDELARDLARAARFDQLGRNEIIYFPGWTVEDDADDDDAAAAADADAE